MMVHLHKNTFPFCHLNMSQVSKWFETFFSGLHYMLQFILEMFSEVKNRTLCCPCSNQDCFVIVHVNKGQHNGIGRGSLFRISQCDSIVILPRTTRGASSCHEKQPHDICINLRSFSGCQPHTGPYYWKYVKLPSILQCTDFCCSIDRLHCFLHCSKPAHWLDVVVFSLYAAVL